MCVWNVFETYRVFGEMNDNRRIKEMTCNYFRLQIEQRSFFKPVKLAL